MRSVAHTAKRWGRRGRRRPWLWLKGCSTSAGRWRSRPRRLLLNGGPFPGCDVPAEHLHVLANPRCILRPENARREAKKATRLVVHVIDQSSRSVFALRVRVGPGPVERALDEPAGTLLGLVVNVLLHLELFLMSAQVEVVAVTRPLSGRSIVELLHLVEVGRPSRNVPHVLSDKRPDALAGRFDVDNLVQLGHSAIVDFSDCCGFWQRVGRFGAL